MTNYLLVLSQFHCYYRHVLTSLITISILLKALRITDQIELFNHGLQFNLVFFLFCDQKPLFITLKDWFFGSKSYILN